MSKGLDLILIDDDEMTAGVLGEAARNFYEHGEVYVYSDPLEARTFCFARDSSIAIFVLDAYLGTTTAFDFINAVSVHYPMAADDTLIVTGHASDEVVNMCLSTGVNHLLEKPVKFFAFQLAVKAIAVKYTRFAKKLMGDPALAKSLAGMEAAGF